MHSRVNKLCFNLKLKVGDFEPKSERNLLYRHLHRHFNSLEDLVLNSGSQIDQELFQEHLPQILQVFHLPLTIGAPPALKTRLEDSWISTFFFCRLMLIQRDFLGEVEAHCTELEKVMT